MSGQAIYPGLRYADAEAAIAFLGEAFGFEEREVHRGEGGVVVHALLALEGNLVMLGQHDGGAWLGGEPPRPGVGQVGLYIALADPDAHHDRAVAAGARIVRELEDTDYGSREYSARDPEGILWSFGTYRPSAGA
jgi:uncharacterized glyoxalase superfamily protein PhnB